MSSLVPWPSAPPHLSYRRHLACPPGGAPVVSVMPAALLPMWIVIAGPYAMIADRSALVHGLRALLIKPALVLRSPLGVSCSCAIAVPGCVAHTGLGVSP